MTEIDPPWLTPEEMTAWLRLIGVVELLPGVLDAQLRRDADLSHFDYMTLAMLSEAPGRTLRMTELAELTNATLPRLSHVVTRLGERGLIERQPCQQDKRATNAVLTAHGWEVVKATAPGHVAHARATVFDPLTPDQVSALAEVMGLLLERVDPTRRMAGHVSPERPGTVESE